MTRVAHRQIPILFLVSFLAFLLLSGKAFAPDEAQKAWLRMYAGGSIYIGTNIDPWISESYVIYGGSAGPITADITVDNFKKERNVNDVVVSVVTNNVNTISSIIVNGTNVYPGAAWRTGTLAMTADDGTALGELPPHGVYNDPAASWIEYRSGKRLTGDGTLGESILIRLTTIFKTQSLSTAKIHLDAYGWTEELGKKAGVITDDTSDAVFAPFSHDVTITVPELSMPTLVAMSLGLCGCLFIKARNNKRLCFTRS